MGFFSPKINIKNDSIYLFSIGYISQTTNYRNLFVAEGVDGVGEGGLERLVADGKESDCQGKRCGGCENP
jgi:hypothetical protein